MKSTAFILGLLVCLGACSSTKDGPGDPYATVPEFCAAWGSAACNDTVIERCSGVDPGKVTDAQRQACTTKQSNYCETLLPTTGYGSVNAKACIDAVKAAYSDGILTSDDLILVRHRGDACAALVKGPKAAGDTCTVNDDCDTLTGVSCIMQAGVGHCGIPKIVANGEACTDPDATCNPTFYCDGSNCVKEKAAKAKCTASYECAGGLTCDADTTSATAGTCITATPNASCTSDADCPAGTCEAALNACVSSVQLAPAEAICGDLR